MPTANRAETRGTNGPMTGAAERGAWAPLSSAARSFRRYGFKPKFAVIVWLVAAIVSVIRYVALGSDKGFVARL